MFIMSLKYLVPLEKVDEVRAEHLEFLKKYYSKSIFLASGPKIPRTGGIIMANAITREELDDIVKQDPFWQNQIAEYEITEFVPTMGVFTSKE